MALSADQKNSLNRAKLAALARSDIFAESGPFEPVEFPGGAMALSEDGAVALALLTGDVLSAMGGALSKAASSKDGPEAALHLLVDINASNAPALGGSQVAEVATVADVAHAASGFDPSPQVWEVDGTDIRPASTVKLNPPSSELPFDDALVSQMRDAGVEIVVEEGIIIGEVLGLEVARIAASAGYTELRLQVGVGAYDQEAFAAINPDVAPLEALPRVVEEIRQHRRPGADPHPINRLVRERWVRALLMEDPSTIGLRRLAPVPSLRVRSGLRDVVPALALGSAATSDGGTEVVLVACSTGVDFGLVPTAADAAHRFDADRVILVVPAKDRYPYLNRLVDKMRIPTTVLDAPEPWAS